MTDFTITEDFPKAKLNLMHDSQTEKLVTNICLSKNGLTESGVKCRVSRSLFPDPASRWLKI